MIRSIDNLRLNLILFLFFFLCWTCARIDAQVPPSAPQILYIEAESFSDQGGWGLDSQSIDSVGSPYLIAPGRGEPVADAHTKVAFPRAGNYRVFVRTRNWVADVAPNEAPGRFALSVDGNLLATEFGTNGAEWAWQEGESVEIGADRLEVEIALRDLTGFNGRVDALLFTTDDSFVPPNDRETLSALRREALGLPDEPPFAAEGKRYDLVVAGGGIAGTCAAIAAARLGCDVALIQDRPVLGGNGSSEIRVHLNGDVNMEPYSNLGNLTRLMGPHGGGNARGAEHYKDARRLELVEAEKKIDLYLGMRVDAADVEVRDGARHIVSVRGMDLKSGRELRFLSRAFADCTGDAQLGYLAGADWRMGREAKSEYDEPSAPEESDSLTMGSSVQWNTVDVGVPTTFPELPWAMQFNEETIRPSTHGDWDWECGMDRDQTSDMEGIRDLGLRAAYGHWSYMKNHSTGEWAERVKNMKLNWVAYVAGKRESRRLLGDVVLREQDVVEARSYPDASVTTTWSIDLHYPEPQNAVDFPGEAFRAICRQTQIKPYAIPYRCFYSRNVDNLFMAGRDISVTHIALGTTRVMRTGGMMGEVVGMAASICKKNNCLPRDVYAEHLDDLIALMKEGVAPPSPKTDALTRPRWLAEDAKNLALDAKIEVSSNYKDCPYPKENINDGKFDINSNEGRWVSDYDDGHWVDIIFDEPTTIDALRLVTGQANGKTPIADFELEYEKDGRLVDASGVSVAENDCPIVALQFKPITSKRFRLVVAQTPSWIARIWELELYHIGNE